jgi:DNA-binding winged helix-turn-helix (wHTH) protein
MTYLFEQFALDEDRFELRRGGALVAVQPKVLDLILFLVRSRERVVSKRELLECVWDGLSVTSASLAQAVRAARRALEDDADSPHVIQTIRRRGYRFIAPVRTRPNLSVVPAPSSVREGTRPEVQAAVTLVIGDDAATEIVADDLVRAASARGARVDRSTSLGRRDTASAQGLTRSVEDALVELTDPRRPATLLVLPDLVGADVWTLLVLRLLAGDPGALGPVRVLASCDPLALEGEGLSGRLLRAIVAEPRCRCVHAVAARDVQAEEASAPSIRAV